MEILKSFQAGGSGIPEAGEYLPELRAYLGDVRKSVQTEVLHQATITIYKFHKTIAQKCPRWY